jgi:thiol-disulfide isomerase/thioredoxin
MTRTDTAGRSDRTWWYVALGFVALWGVGLAYFGPGGRLGRPSLAPPAQPLPADYSWRLLDLNEGPVEFARFRGKPVFLNVWATWCPPCVAELPSIERLASRPGLDGVAFVCVSTDESAQNVRRFLAGKNWPMTVLRATELPPVFQTEVIPATFLIAPDGRVAVAEVGAVNWDDPFVVDFLKGLVEKGNSPATVVERKDQTQ